MILAFIFINVCVNQMNKKQTSLYLLWQTTIKFTKTKKNKKNIITK